MPQPVLLTPDKGYDFSGIEHYENINTPAYAAAKGTPYDSGYRYVELYGDGTIHLQENYGYDSDGLAIRTTFCFNPNSERGYFGNYAIGAEQIYINLGRRLLLDAGVPESAFEPQDNSTDSFSFVDRYAGAARDSASRLTETALHALQFSRWYNYDTDGDGIQHDRMTRADYASAIGTIVGRFGEVVLGTEVNRMIDLHLSTLHTNIHTPGLGHKPHSDGTPRDEGFMDTAAQVIRGSHNLYHSMRDAGKWVNFLSIFGDADFWAITREHYPSVFNSAADHFAALPDPYEQPRNMNSGPMFISPIALIRSYFAKAYAEITIARPDLTSDVPANRVIIPM